MFNCIRRLSIDFEKEGFKRTPRELALSFVEVLYLYHILTRQVSAIKVTPSREWQNADALLGLKVRAEKLAQAKQCIFRVNGLCRYDLKGLLRPGEDFVLTAKKFSYKDPKELKEKMHTMGQCELVVYSLVKQTLRFEELDLCNGSLGIEIGTGMLNDLDYNFALVAKDNKKGNWLLHPLYSIYMEQFSTLLIIN